MTELTILYCAFAYLFTLGMVIGGWDNMNKAHVNGALITVLFAPVLFPFALGFLLTNK